ncbi:acetyl/propionyl/methylcrotonyl-CoA carboxylase subunit alpha [Sulfitobacter pacificus]|uniref:3-methylcrotonyl-CoA carboxylase subunit alpha n=1 Tax=Sulfitobacter pacificus TaxID=1499314 RepID=A0ABQ5VPR8_9RHOB|nr:acetyl-CoA carboxylase biotin carboxylase subunit [Sulfitobacter pacificus]GLQ29203.1 3-methylcrotonyl-CoA carboxylase subunit alpha [Sulfitobacter pacificus]
MTKLEDTQKFNRILIANRGEIACRVIQTARAMGFSTVAICSEADTAARHVTLADAAVEIGPAQASKSYLKIENVIDAAKKSGAQAVHPGYGFLSENAAFADACADAGLVFIGPSSEAMRAMGDKAIAKRRMIDAGVPCVPGYQGDNQEPETFVTEADRIGYPVMVKAAAGGGGRGMRLVHQPADLLAALKAARSEAQNAFGDGTLLIEKAVIEPRHIEIQVFGDQHGNVIHLGERDCSIQRRHQKVVEESPSPAVDPQLRSRMGEAAVQAARAINYVGAGTVEFLLDASGDFYFLEMNTRLQVEHPVTELVTGLDLVAMQLEVAAGGVLPLRQEDVQMTGHAIEVRLYAEDPAKGFLPQTGEVLLWEPSALPGVRTDHGLNERDRVSPFYDPMVAKIIAHGEDREVARRRLMSGLSDTVLFGITTNKSFLLDILADQEFVAGVATTAFIERRFPDGWKDDQISNDVLTVAAVLFCGAGQAPDLRPTWLNAELILRVGDTDHGISARAEDDLWKVLAGDQERTVRFPNANSTDPKEVVVDGMHRQIRVLRQEERLYLELDGRVRMVEDRTYAPAEGLAAGSDGLVRAPMNGLVTFLDVALGEVVEKGRVVAVLEAMKMQHRILAPKAGRIDKVAVEVGSQVATRDVLFEIEELVKAAAP